MVIELSLLKKSFQPIITVMGHSMEPSLNLSGSETPEVAFQGAYNSNFLIRGEKTVQSVDYEAHDLSVAIFYLKFNSLQASLKIKVVFILCALLCLTFGAVLAASDGTGLSLCSSLNILNIYAWKFGFYFNFSQSPTSCLSLPTIKIMGKGSTVKE
ncbi:hypothetical protein NQ317_016570 [Molorchus minor]|uniref:Uncharacterized protein n=1 Tax=Molorchus minor TaxID=1323400 RepID=A0ABQ9J2W6_9CUCU|nr:hypothetical protein NQ317_016570 [Molorchus minor]